MKKNIPLLCTLLLLALLSFSCAKQRIRKKVVVDVEGVRKRIVDVDKELITDLETKRTEEQQLLPTAADDDARQQQQQTLKEEKKPPEEVKLTRVGGTSHQMQEVEFEAVGEGVATKYERLIDAEKRAEEDALSKAIKQAGVNVYSGFQNVLQYSDRTINQFVAKYTNVWAAALVSYERTDKTQWVQTGEVNRCIVKIKGKIYFKGEPDPNFYIKVDNFHPVYYEGDKVNLKITVSKDAYVTILSCDEDGNVSVLFPNIYSKNNFIKSTEELLIPQNVGFELVTYLPQGRTESVELLHIIATKMQPFITPEEVSKKEKIDKGMVIYPLGNLKELSVKLAKFNRHDWTQEVLVYKIVKKTK